MDTLKGVGDAAAKVVAAAASQTAAVVGEVVETVGEKLGAAGLDSLPEDRASLLDLHRAARRRRDAAPLLSKARAEAAFEIERIEIQVARIERAMDPPLV